MKKSLLATFVLVGLTACGSSGGGSSDNSSATPTNSVQNTNQNIQPTSPNTASQNSNKTGGALIMRENSVSHQTITNPSLSEIVVEGKTMLIQFPGIYSGSWSNINNSNSTIQICCGKYSSVRFGVIDREDEELGYAFYNGVVTKDMPTSGTASYTGGVIISGNNQAFEEEDWLTGDSKFEVDFANKQLKGDFNVPNLAPITVNATINGTDFSGNASSTDFASTQLEGKFYGEKAAELGGLFGDSSSDWGGSFGAKKQ